MKKRKHTRNWIEKETMMLVYNIHKTSILTKNIITLKDNIFQVNMYTRIKYPHLVLKK